MGDLGAWETARDSQKKAEAPLGNLGRDDSELPSCPCWVRPEGLESKDRWRAAGQASLESQTGDLNWTPMAHVYRREVADALATEKGEGKEVN